MKGCVGHLRLGPNPPPLVPDAACWTEYAVTSSQRIWEPVPGTVAVFRTDHPGTLARWDGEAWSFQPLPFSTAMPGLAAEDDRGHLLLGRMGGQRIAFDIGPKRVTPHGDESAMLKAAVDAGPAGSGPVPDIGVSWSPPKGASGTQRRRAAGACSSTARTGTA